MEFELEENHVKYFILPSSMGSKYKIILTDSYGLAKIAAIAYPDSMKM